MREITNHGVIDHGPSNGVREFSHASEGAGGASYPRPPRTELRVKHARIDDSVGRSIYGNFIQNVIAKGAKDRATLAN